MSESEQPVRVAERHKRAGLHYAINADGVELPVIDVTHPTFAALPDDARLQALVADYAREQRRWGLVPNFLRRALYRLVLRGSLLGTGMRAAEGGFLGGMSTYLFKLGPENLGEAYASALDRKIVATLPGIAMRVRLHDMASILADSLLPRLSVGPRRPLHFINIAGGPAMDSINALLLLNLREPRALSGRSVRIEVLDMVAAGPFFGQRALSALSVPGGPLHGLDVALRHTPYDWSRVEVLARSLELARREGALVVGSSEGGLFEYGTDQVIVENLCCLQQHTARDFTMVGSVTRADEHWRSLHTFSRVATHPRGLLAFQQLLDRTGFTLVRVLERPFSDHVLLEHSGA